VFDTRGSVISLPRELSDVFGGERGQHTVECAERERERKQSLSLYLSLSLSLSLALSLWARVVLCAQLVTDEHIYPESLNTKGQLHVFNVQSPVSIRQDYVCCRTN